MRSEDEAVETLRRAHRDAADRLDDVPDARVRAAVLAAAARGVDARPRLATPASTGAAVSAASRARRWPLSAAALLVVSVMTGLVATQVLRDRPERATTIASSAPTVPSKSEAAAPQPGPSQANVSAAALPPATAPSAAASSATSPATTASSAPKRRPRSEPAPTGTHANVERSVEAMPTAPSPSRSAFVAPPPAAAPSSPVRDARAKAEAGADPAADASRDAGADVDTRAAPEQNRTAAPASLATMTATRARIGRIAEPSTPEAWVARIVQLRADGHDAEADRELEALRRRYPAFAIPSNALAPSGTR